MFVAVQVDSGEYLTMAEGLGNMDIVGLEYVSVDVSPAWHDNTGADQARMLRACLMIARALPPVPHITVDMWPVDNDVVRGIDTRLHPLTLRADSSLRICVPHGRAEHN